MKNVQILPPEIISKIAAGEVIERPASVIKELLENSLDAKTKRIEINLTDAGKTYIQIKDTGLGIENDDIETIFLRHSTSKIKTTDDLYNIHSLGFRGEALYSIAAISDVILRSKTHSHDTGWEINIRGGKKISLHPKAMSTGTEIEIKGLFFNTPARRKFLKSDAAELLQILNVVLPYTILYPDITFLFTHNNKTILDLKSTNNNLERIEQSINVSQKNLITAQNDLTDLNCSLSVILGDINIQRTKRDMQFIFINNRPVQNRNISFQMNLVYRSLFPSEIFPFFAIFITIPPENIDVNIHPTKREVQIHNEQLIITRLKTLCNETLMSTGKPKQIDNHSTPYFNAEPSFTPFPETAKQTKLSFDTPLPTQYSVLKKNTSGIHEPQNPLFIQAQSLKTKLSQAQFIGTFINKYVIFEVSHSLLILDQHAAQERITYEQMLDQVNDGKLEVQHLLTPIIVRVLPQEMLTWEIAKDQLEKIGLTTTLWDTNNIAIHTHPQLIQNCEIAMRNILSGEEKIRFDNETFLKRACHNSLKTGYKMDKSQAEYMRTQLIKCQTPFTCPHGRPTIIELPEHILQRYFLRT